MRNTRKAVNKERLCFTPKHLLQEIFSLRHVVIDVRLLDNSTPPVMENHHKHLKDGGALNGRYEYLLFIRPEE